MIKKEDLPKNKKGEYLDRVGNPFPPKLVHEIDDVVYVRVGIEKRGGATYTDVKNLCTGEVKRDIPTSRVRKWFNF